MLILQTIHSFSILWIFLGGWNFSTGSRVSLKDNMEKIRVTPGSSLSLELAFFWSLWASRTECLRLEAAEVGIVTPRTGVSSKEVESHLTPLLPTSYERFCAELIISNCRSWQELCQVVDHLKLTQYQKRNQNITQQRKSKQVTTSTQT